MPERQDRLKVAALLLAALLGLAAVGYQAWRLRPGGKAPAQQPNPVICRVCGHSERRTTRHLPQRCPRCRANALGLAGLCPRCGAWTPWPIERERELFAAPGLWLQRGPAYFFPRCRVCGTPTNGTGRQPPRLPAARPTRRPSHAQP